jgi:Glycosyltransferase family 9 (heptosyltransferase)
VSWGSRRAQRKSMPVNLLEPLAAVSNNLLFVSLQNNEVGHEAAFAPQLNMLDFRQSLLDLADTAALIANMDLIISVDTSVAHLAGAMGKPVWMPLMERADWRWGESGDTSVWYPNTRLFRQTEQGNWSFVVKDLCSALRDFIPSQKPVLQ